MTEDREADIRLTIQNIISKHEDQMFAEFDQLHKKDIHDGDVRKALIQLDYNDLVDGYEEWMHDGEPVRADEDGPLDQGEQLVTDPGDAPSYTSLDGALGTERGDRESWPATPGEVVDELTAAGINANNLERAILQTVVEETRKRRIEHGIFYAEPSVMGGWNVYKKRSADDNGAFIGHSADENAAIRILESLGEGL